MPDSNKNSFIPFETLDTNWWKNLKQKKGNVSEERQLKRIFWKWGVLMPVLIWLIVAFLFILEVMFFEGEHLFLTNPIVHWVLIGFGIPFAIISLFLILTHQQDDIFPITRRLAFVRKQGKHHVESIDLSDMYSKILEHVPMSILTCDIDGQITSVNSYYSTLSAKNMDLVLGQNLLEKKWIRQSNLRNKYVRLLKEGVPFREYGLLYVTDDGMERYLDIMAVPTRDESGNIVGAISMAQDSTQMNVYGQKMIQQTQQLYILNQVTQAINSTKDISEILWIILRNTVKLFGDDTSCTIIMSDENDMFVKEAYPPKFSDGKVISRLPSEKGIVGYVLRTKKPYFSNNVKNDPYYVDDGLSTTQSELAVPAVFEGRVIALINIESTKLNKFSQEHVELMETLSHNVAIAIHNADLYTEIQKSEEKFRTLVSDSIAGIYIIQDGIFKYTNPAFQKMFGYTENELTDMDYTSVVSDQFKVFGNEAQGDFRDIQEGETFSLTCIRKDGREIDIEGKFSYTFFNGKPAIQGFAVDVTKTKRAVEALRESEKKYSDLVERAHDGISIIQGEKFVFVNKAFGKMFEYPELEIIGTSCYQIFTQESKKKLAKFFALPIEKRLTSPYLELQAECKNKSLKHITLNIGMIEYLGRPAYIVIMRDDTKRKKLEEHIKEMNKDLEMKVAQRTDELKKANTQLQEAIDLKSKFIANSSHELRTPLTIIKGNLELALMTKISEDQEELFEAINTEVDHMSHILSELSVLTKADSLQDQSLKTKTVALDTVLIKAVKAMEVIANQKNISMQITQMDEGVLMGSEEYLDRLFHNLLSNALKYGKSGGFVKVALKDKGDNFYITVQDNGIGITEKELPYVFERFYRTKEARAKEEAGSGLGLAICHWIVQTHGGQIGVESTEGKGSIFSVTFPKNTSN